MSAYLKIVINSEDDAFSSNPQDEVARILHDIADRISQGFCSESITDINGNFCGNVAASFSEDD